MPFTPFHMGPGLLIKSVLQGSFSLMLFGWAQILIDIQPLLVILSGKGTLHGISHTYLGATFIAVAAALSGKHLAEFGLRLLGVSKTGNPLRISWPVAFSSAFIGTYSHILLDALGHYDVMPYYPFSPRNELAGALIGYMDLYSLCLYSGALGAVLYFSVQFYLTHLTRMGDG